MVPLRVLSRDPLGALVYSSKGLRGPFKGYYKGPMLKRALILRLGV